MTYISWPTYHDLHIMTYISCRVFQFGPSTLKKVAPWYKGPYNTSHILWYSDWIHNTTSAGSSIMSIMTWTGGQTGLGLVDRQDLDWWTGRTWTGGQAGLGLVDRQDLDWWTDRTWTGGKAGLGLVDRTKSTENYYTNQYPIIIHIIDLWFHESLYERLY